MPLNHKFSLVLDGSGEFFYCCGYNDTGQLGIGTRSSKMEFTRVNLPGKFSSISAGWEGFCVAVAEDGSLWSWGSNSDGQLGINKDPLAMPYVLSPVQIQTAEKFTQASAGWQFALALDTFGNVWSFGDNYKGQLGLGHTRSQYIPVIIPRLSNITQISTGCQFAIVLDSCGNLWSFGANDFGELGLGSTEAERDPRLVSVDARFVQISSGWNHNLVLDTFGRVWSFGRNCLGQLGLGSNSHQTSPKQIQSLENVSKVICGGNSSYVIDIYQRVFVFGGNEFDQFDLQDDESRWDPIEKESWHGHSIIPAGFHTLVVDQEGHLSVFGFIFGGCQGKQDVEVEQRTQVRLQMKRARP